MHLYLYEPTLRIVLPTHVKRALETNSERRNKKILEKKENSRDLIVTVGENK